MTLWLPSLTGCWGHNKPLAPLVVSAKTELVRIEKGQTITAQDKGWWVSDELLAKIMQNLREAAETIRELRKSQPMTNNLSAEIGQSPDDSARLWRVRKTNDHAGG